jgi:hypothetical protein
MGEVPAADIDLVQIDIGQRIRDAMAAGVGAWGIRVNYVELTSGEAAAGGRPTVG